MNKPQANVCDLLKSIADILLGELMYSKKKRKLGSVKKIQKMLSLTAA